MFSVLSIQCRVLSVLSLFSCYWLAVTFTENDTTTNISKSENYTFGKNQTYLAPNVTEIGK